MKTYDADVDLPLFRWSPPKCVVLPFPTSRRAGKIRRTVEVLSSRHGKGADQYWNQVIAGMRSQMIAAGLPDETIDRELRDFATAVFGRIRMSAPRTGGDAA